jgi:hypothetical protein
LNSGVKAKLLLDQCSKVFRNLTIFSPIRYGGGDWNAFYWKEFPFLAGAVLNEEERLPAEQQEHSVRKAGQFIVRATHC